MFARLPICMAGAVVVFSVTATPEGVAYVGQAWLQFTSVKTWSGNIAIDATEVSSAGEVTTTSTYNAKGAVTLTDNLSSDPEAVHSVWPFPTPAELADPKRAPDAFKRWTAQVTYASRATGKDELAQRVDAQCQGSGNSTALVQLTISPMSTNYSVRIEPPAVAAKCAGTSTLDTSNTPTQQLLVELPLPSAKGPLTGTKTLTSGGLKATVSFTLTPS